MKVGANNQEKVVVLEGVSEGDLVYRTPPGGQADPKFDQPEAPPPEPLQEVSGDEVTSDTATKRSDAAANYRGRGRSSKKYAQMTPEELGEAKSQLSRLASSMSNWMSGERLDRQVQKINAIVNAIDQKKFEEAQRLRDAMMQFGGSGRGRRPSGGRPDGGRGGE